MYQVQLDGLRNFGLPTLDELYSKLKELGKPVGLVDMERIYGCGQNQTIGYVHSLFNKNVYEIIEEVNSAYTDSSSCL